MISKIERVYWSGISQLRGERRGEGCKVAFVTEEAVKEAMNVIGLFKSENKS